MDRVSETPCPHCESIVDVSSCEPLLPVDCPVCGRSMTVPGRLGSFVLLEILGRGGMGSVYRALDTTLNRHVAIKVMRGSLGDDLQFSSDLANEARSAAALNHPHVAQVYAFGEEKGQPYIVMELASGGRLDKMIKRQGPLDEDWVLDRVIEVAQGLQAAQKAGLIHADIKPANIVFDEKGRAKLVDFGLAQSAVHSIEGGESWGTPFYVAPEQVKKLKIDHRADIYSLGATMFHALAGRAPFIGQSSSRIVKARFEGPPTDLRELRPELREATARTVARMLAEKRTERYPTYASLLADLEAAREGAAPRPVKTPRRKPVEEEDRRKVSVLPFAIVLVFALAAGGLLFMLRQEPSGPSRVIGRQPNGAQVVPARPGSIEAHREAFARAVGDLAAGKSFAAAQQLQALQNELMPDDALMGQVMLVQAFTAWSDRMDTAARPFLEEMEKRQGDEELRGLARFMSGSVTMEDLLASAAGWDVEGRTMADLVAGVHLLREEDSGATTVLERYVESASALNGLPVDLVPMARRWIHDEAEVRATLAQAASLSGAKASRILTGLKGTAAPVFSPRIDRGLAEAAGRVQAEGQARQQAQQREREQQDGARLDALKTRLEDLDGDRAFDEALLAVREAAEAVKTESIRNQVSAMEPRYERLATLKVFLVDRINDQPPRGAVPGLGQTIAGADAKGVTLPEDGGTVPWSEVSTRAWLALFDAYLERSDVSDEEAVGLLLGCAVFCDLEGGPRSARAYADQAIERDPGMEAEVGRLLSTDKP